MFELELGECLCLIGVVTSIWTGLRTSCVLLAAPALLAGKQTNSHLSKKNKSTNKQTNKTNNQLSLAAIVRANLEM